MKKLAQVTNGIVDAILKTDKKPNSKDENRIFVDISNIECELGQSYIDGSFVSPDPTPKTISKYKFLTMLKDVGVTNEQIAQAKSDTNLTVFWILFDAAEDIKPSDQSTIDGLNALLSLGYLTSVQAVMDVWPEE